MTPSPRKSTRFARAWCPICGEGFISRHGVNGHQRVHKKETIMTEKIKPFPEELFVKLETETNDDPFFVLYESAKEVAEPDEEIEVAVYRLVRTTKVKAPVSVDAGDSSI
jgi:hypothetical protein